MKEKIQINKLPTPTWNFLRVNSATVQWDNSIPTAEEHYTAADSPIKLCEGFGSKKVTISAGEGSTVTVVELVNPADASRTELDFELAAGAKVKLVQLLNPSSGALLIHRVTARLAEGAKFSLISAVLGDGDIYTDTAVELDGDSSSLEADYGYLGMNAQKIDINLAVNHRGKKTESEIKANGALMDSAEKVFRGTIDFKNGSSDSVGAENETVLMLGDNVVNKTVPLILCAEENVEGTHGATIGELDSATLFYFESRGIDKEHASDIMARASVERIARLPGDGEFEKAVEEALVRQLKPQFEGDGEDE